MGKDQDQPGTALATLDQYDPRQFNVLHPIVQVGQDIASPVLVESVSVVPIRPHPDAGEVYHDPRYAPEGWEKEGRRFPGKYALAALALGKIAGAAGIKWVPQHSGVVDRYRTPDGHIYIRYRATGAVRQPNGEWHLISAEKEIDTADFAEARADEYRRKIAQGRHLHDRGPRKGQPRYTEAEIPEMVRRDVLQLKEHMLGHAETKAQNRVIRKLLSLKQVYTEEELARPFVVPRLLYRPDLADPLQLEQVQIEGRQAAADIYGAPSLPPGEPAPGWPSIQPPPDASAGPRGSDEEVTPSVTTLAGPAEPSSGQATARRPGAEGAARPQAEGEAAPSAGARGKAPDGEGGTAPTVPADGPGEPKEDPMLDGEQYPPQIRGRRMSEVAETHPDFLRGLLSQTRAAKRRQLIESWLAWQQPTLGGGA